MFDQAHVRAAIAVSLGAIAGALCRHYMGQLLTHSFGSAFPWGTLGVNLSGCFLMGGVVVWLAQRGPDKPEVVLMLTTGFLGSYTTFSTYALDLANLADRPSWLPDLSYGLGSPLLGLGCLVLGLFIARTVWPRPPSDRSSPD
ncbi:fluoride efflux transporter CrcB [Halomicronema sp. CCY15110]|uniref:fluoride efflux transporter CrcB n=1 Tax=Halomicronema sp. CCY15110 TaxID=2767773 RepID=UPI00194F5965|nr:fluoride efflux transporter CrcB [Halomicronema sp. CCY15110]